MMELVSQQEYQALVNQISNTYEQGRQRAAQAVDTQLVSIYWEIGQYIVEFEQEGLQRAKYGKALINITWRKILLACMAGALAGVI